MNFFFGAAMQGVQKTGERAEHYRTIISTINENGGHVLTEEINGSSFEGASKLSDEEIRNQMITFLESDDLAGIIFEVSTPSLGTGVEFTHAYMRPHLGFREVPILALYEKDHWPNGLSTMIKGLNHETAPQLKIVEYTSLDNLGDEVATFVTAIQSATT